MSSLIRVAAIGAALIIVLLVLPVFLLRGGMDADVQRDDALIGSQLVNGLSLATTLKMQVSEYYHAYGELPPDAASLDHGSTEAAGWRRRQGLGLGPRGVITVHVPGAEGGIVGTVRLVPRDAAAAMPLEWDCVSSDFRGIKRVAPQCRYQQRSP